MKKIMRVGYVVAAAAVLFPVADRRSGTMVQTIIFRARKRRQAPVLHANNVRVSMMPCGSKVRHFENVSAIFLPKILAMERYAKSSSSWQATSFPRAG